MSLIPIDTLISIHWAGCDVQQGETPEAYASRHEEEIEFLIRCWTFEAWVSLADEFYRTEPTKEPYE